MPLLSSILCSFLLYVAPCLPPTSHVTLKGAGLCLSFSLITSNSLFSRRRPYHVCGRTALSLALKSTLILPFTHIPTFSQWLEMQGSLNMSCFWLFDQQFTPLPMASVSFWATLTLLWMIVLWGSRSLLFVYMHACRCVYSVFSSQLSACYPRNDHRRLDFLCFVLLLRLVLSFPEKAGCSCMCALVCMCQRQRSSS